MISALIQDLRYGFRTMLRSPGFTTVVVLTLGLGIGATTTIFSLASALMLRPPPVIHEPSRLVTVRGAPLDLSYPDLADIRSEARSLSRVAARKAWAMDVRVGEETRRTRGALASSNYFEALGVAPVLGRFFTPDEEAVPGAPAAVVLGHDAWRSRLAADPGAVGRVIAINGHPFTVVGVAPEGFRGPTLFETEELWVPLAMHHEVAPGLLASVRERWPRWLTALGRLAPGYRAADARAELDVVAGRQARTYPESRRQSVTVAGFRAEERALVAPYLTLLGAIVGAVLLIACANVAGLLLARGAGRRREIAIRAAMGAGRARLVRQLLAESLLLSAAGAAAGLVLTVWATRALALWLPAHMEDFPAWLSLAPDVRVLLFATLLAVLTSVLFGLAPAHQLSAVDLVTGLKEGVAAGAFSRTRLRRLLVALQVALSLILTAGTGALVKTLRSLMESTPALAPERVLQGWLEPALGGYDPIRATDFYARLVERIRALPGVTSVTLARNRLPWDRSFFDERVVAQGRAGPDSLTGVGYEVIAPGYFQTMGYALLRGRDVEDRDREGAPHVVVVNQALARRLWPAEDPIGKRLTLWGDDEREVVGLARDRAWREEPAPFMYLPLAQRNPWPASPMILHVRTAGRAEALAPAVRREVAALDANLPVFRVGTLAQAVEGELAAQILASAIIGVAGLLALLLSAVGLYGLMAHAVGRRTHEFGVRMALGAARADVLGQVVREGMVAAAGGLVVGTVAAVMLTGLMLRTLFGAGVAAPDALTLGAAVVVLGLAVLLACVVPARRAVRVDPVEALRCE